MSIAAARFPEDRPVVEALFREYQQSLGIDLDFQSFDEEMAALPGKYARPRGDILLAFHGGKPAGCIAWYPLKADICEIKRLYVRPVARGQQLGKYLLEYAIMAVRRQGYRKLRLDSLARLKKARKLYESFAFRPIAPYNVNPFPDVYYLELDLIKEPEPARKAG
jgi:GNAT superfamily N-acetyltransferase